MTIYNKLVRDKIPEIIEHNGEIPHTRILSKEEYTILLEEKLDEEVGEYHSDKSIEELADILEVVFAIADNVGSSRHELMEVYQQKHNERGGFAGRLFLVSKRKQ